MYLHFLITQITLFFRYRLPWIMRKAQRNANQILSYFGSISSFIGNKQTAKLRKLNQFHFPTRKITLHSLST